MYPAALLVVSVAIFALLLQLNVLVALFFLILAIVSIPALIIQRREGAAAIEMEPDAESSRRGWMRLMGIVGLDVAGIALGVLLIILIALLVRELGRLGGH